MSTPDEQLAKVREIQAAITTALPEAISWTHKADARQTGFSLHIKFDQKVDVITTTLPVVGLFVNSPQTILTLAELCERLLVEAGAS